MRIKFRQVFFKIKNNTFHGFHFWGIDFPHEGDTSSPAESNVDYTKDNNQFTGLLDQNGKEIYEGDIFGWNTQWGVYRGVVEFVEYNDAEQYVDDKHLGWRVIIKYKSTEYAGNDLTLPDALLKAYYLGNIYENPDIIK